MQIVIDIPEKIYKHILSMQFYIPGSRSGKSLLEEILKAIRTGTPLPKGHGDLVDTSYFEHYLRDTYIDSVSFKRAISAMKRLSTIIEADKEQEHDT